MRKKVLARLLRAKQLKLGRGSKEEILATLDDDIILSYLTCASCDELHLEPATVWSLVSQATCLDHFFYLCDVAMKGHAKMHQLEQDGQEEKISPDSEYAFDLIEPFLGLLGMAADYRKTVGENSFEMSVLRRLETVLAHQLETIVEVMEDALDAPEPADHPDDRPPDNVVFPLKS